MTPNLSDYRRWLASNSVKLQELNVLELHALLHEAIRPPERDDMEIDESSYDFGWGDGYEAGYDTALDLISMLATPSTPGAAAS